MKKRVLVAMSGGVDSSVAAALLVEQGYEVVGMTMQVWDYTQCDIQEGNGTCCSSVDVDDARSVADRLNIPFYVLNCEKEFKQAVIDPFINAYLSGNTPVPCVNCNTFLKFDHLFEKMFELKCDYLATGHYAKINMESGGEAKLQTSSDSWKDQTYFLFTLKPELLKYLMFPIGHLQKTEVRKIAEEKGLLNARKKDSTGICFIGPKGHGAFIEEHVSKDKLKPGTFRRHPTGEILGEHAGIHRFTMGQRRGFGIDHHESLFVVKIDVETHTVWLGDEKELFASSLQVQDMNLLSPVEDGERVKIKIRYAHSGAWGKIIFESQDKARIEFEEPQRAITSGQAAVIYRGAELVGGGWIQ